MGSPNSQISEDRPNAGISRMEQPVKPFFQFSICTMFLVMTLAAVCSGVIALDSGIGIASTAIAIVALARTSVTSYLYRKVNAPLDMVAQVWEFGASCVLVMFAFLIGSVCMRLVTLVSVVGSGGPGVVAICLSLGAGLLAFVATLWLTRPQ